MCWSGLPSFCCRPHPNANEIEMKPWGFREFGVRDKTDFCVVFRQPSR
jgi:hypothetical protein